jgi:hypothetical protein
VHLQAAPQESSAPVLAVRSRPVEPDYASDPDGDIVHPRAYRPGELEEGATIRVRLLNHLSTATTEKGESFKTRVATDVIQNGRVMIPAGTEIDGQVVAASRGHVGGRGTMQLRPETMILPNGTRYNLHADLSGLPGTKNRVNREGTIEPGSRMGRNVVEYGGAMGAGATTGAMMGGAVGAITGGAIGAGVVTAHLLISHPQATLEAGTALVFTLTEPLAMDPAEVTGE